MQAGHMRVCCAETIAGGNGNTILWFDDDPNNFLPYQMDCDFIITHIETMRKMFC